MESTCTSHVHEIGLTGGVKGRGKSFDAAEWKTKLTIFLRLRIPFRYKELTRPVRAGPFPLSMTKTPSIPKTVFAFSLRTRRRNYNDVEVHVSCAPVFVQWISHVNFASYSCLVHEFAHSRSQFLSLSPYSETKIP